MNVDTVVLADFAQTVWCVYFENDFFFSSITLCAGDEAQPHGEPDHASSVVLRLWQGGFPGA